jgi:hypothetical protein
MASFLSSLSDVPLIGGFVDTLRGNPDDIKAAYDSAMGQSAANQEKLKAFLMGQQQKAQGFYAPLQQMFSRAYGQGSIAPPTQATVPGSTPITSMFNQSRGR